MSPQQEAAARQQGARVAEEARPVVERAIEASKHLLEAWESLEEGTLPVPPVTPPRAIATCRQDIRGWWSAACAAKPDVVLVPGYSSASTGAAQGG